MPDAYLGTLSTNSVGSVKTGVPSSSEHATSVLKLNTRMKLYLITDYMENPLDEYIIFFIVSQIYKVKLLF